MSLTSPLYPGQRLSREEFLRRWGVASATRGCKAGNNRTWFMLESAPAGWISTAPGRPNLWWKWPFPTPGYDLGAKLALYQRAGVREYITVAPEARRVIWRERAGERPRWPMMARAC